ncbi:MAG: alpha/beta hydrolase [Gordonia sp. (in: high G+C Gram-positive bacteria)]
MNWIDLYLPQRSGMLPLIILIHGGAWQANTGAASFAEFARRLCRRGLAVANIEYRRLGDGGGWPTTFTDVAAAMESIPQLAQQYPQIDRRNAIVVGHSAGAQLAVWVSTRHTRHEGQIGGNPTFRPTTVISLAGPLDMRQAVHLGDDRIVRILGGTPTQVPGRYADVDPIQNIDPRTLVIAVAGAQDASVPHVLSQDYVRADTAAGGRAQAIILPGETHSSIVDPKTTAFTGIIDLITRIAIDTHPTDPQSQQGP